MKTSLYEMLGGTYREENGIMYPDLALPEQTNYPIGKYGRMRLEHLKKHRRGTYTTLLTSCTLNQHLYEIEQEAKQQINLIFSRLVKERGIMEELKATDPLRWVQEMNNAKHCAEEIVMNEIIYH
ncbi:MAG: TnpV protein [Clostridia bacterium]|nr:TnpV protein [Clostridia bacterium]